MNIFLIEDEPPILRDLKRTISSFGATYSIVGEAMNGKEALETVLSKLNEIDVVITDIQIPMVNGLEVIERLQKVNGRLKYVVLSGYSEFDYARRAIRMGVVEYLLKPVKETELLEVLEKIAKENLEAYLKEGLNSDIQVEEKPYRCAIAVMGAYCNHMEYESGYAEFMVDIDPDNYWMIRGNNANERYLIFTDEKFKTCKAMFQRMTAVSHRPVTVLIHPDRILIHDVKRNILQLCKKISRYIVLGQSRIIMEGAAGPATRFKAKEKMGTEVGREAAERESLSKGLELIKARFSHGSLKDFKEELRAWLLLAEECGLTQESVMCSLYDILEHCLAGRHSIGLVDLLDEIMAFTYDYETLFTNLYFICMDAYEDAYENNRDIKEMKDRFISGLITYLRGHYMKNISIADLGGYFHYSGSYISKIFREEMGISISDYLLSLRIERAKELLLLPGFRIKDVSSLVGYEDSLYFSKVFKKKEGVSPLEWQKGVKKP